MSIDVRLERAAESVRRSVAAVPIPSVSRSPRVARRRRPGLVVAFSVLTAVVMISVATFALSGFFDRDHARRPTSSPMEDLFPRFPNHVGADLYLSPREVPAGFSTISVTGTTADGSGVYGSLGETQHSQQWVQLDASGAPIGAFTLSWGNNDLAAAWKADPSVPVTDLQPPTGDAIDRYRAAGTPVTLGDHAGYSIEAERSVAWTEHGDVVVVSTGSGPLAALDRVALIDIARNVVRHADGYTVEHPPAGYRLAAQVTNTLSDGAHERVLAYGDGQGHGFSIKLTNDSSYPPGVELANPDARLIAVRGQPAVLSPRRAGAGCGAAERFLCPIGPTDPTPRLFLQWVEPDNTNVLIASTGLTEAELRALADSLAPSTLDQWMQLGARCPERAASALGTDEVSLVCEGTTP
jgi:hypothetical protein